MRKNLTRRNRLGSNDDVSSSMSQMFEDYMLIKKGEGLAKRTIKEHYNNFGYFKEFIKRELSADEITTELFLCWITYMLEEMDYSPFTVNIRVRSMRSFLRYAYEDRLT
jgi:integrase/recombinase XerD